MFYIRKTASTGRYEVNLFGIKMKFGSRNRKNEKLGNLLYELADPRTLQSVRLPKVLNDYDSLFAVLNSQKSLARFGDGEFKLIMGENISFQNFDPELSERLKNILKNQNDNMFIGVPDVFGYCPLDYMRKVMISCRQTLYKYINFDREYVDALFTRKLVFVSDEQGKDYYNKIKSLWTDKNVVIVEGAGSRLGVGNDLLNNAASIKRILCPIKNAYSKYNEILQECLKQSEDSLFILALGPTATVLTEDLTNKGFRALDIGHLDSAYEAFLRKSDKFVHVEGKIVFNEERHENLLKPCKDEDYNRQITAKI